MDSCRPAKPATGMEATDACKSGRGGRADVGNSDAVKVMKIAAAEAAVESAPGKTRGGGCGAGVEVRRRGNAGGAKATRGWAARESMKPRNAAGAWALRHLRTAVNGVRRAGTGNDYAMAMMALAHGAAKAIEVERADPTKAIVPLIAALIPAAAVPPIGVVAIGAAELNGLGRR
jgi:hypothetical protein